MRSLAGSSAPAAFEKRAARAALLAAEAGPAREPLRFARVLLGAQAAAARELEFAHGERPLTGRLADDQSTILGRRAALFDAIAATAPEPLAGEARERTREPDAEATSRLAVYWSGETEARDDFLSRALLRPWAELLRSLGIAPDRPPSPGRCPFCGGLPSISFRRSAPETHGAERRLACSLCGEEWTFNRIRCPACEEDDPGQLPSFQDARYPLVRIEACETCKLYVKSIDLTLDARPIPEVDDLASIALDLWAVEEGYERLESGLAGI